MSALNELGVRFQTDKSTLRHCYLDFYELLFARFNRILYVKLLEIGIQFGNSIRMWREFYPYSEITGIDSIDNHAEGPHSTIIADAYSHETIAKIHAGREFFADKFHIIIDDGSHEPADQDFVVQFYSHLLSPDGILVIEDIGTTEATDKLAAVVPHNFNHAVVDLRSAAPGVYDNMLFVVWRK